MEIPSLLRGVEIAALAGLACAVLACSHAQPPPAAPPRGSESPGAAEPLLETVSAPSCGDAGSAAPAFRWPARGRVTSPFGQRRGRPHEGIDISPSHHDLGVRAAAAGTVLFSDRRPGYGRTIILDHSGGYQSLYAHNQDNLVMKGARVEPGQVIADMGSTGHVSGPHLHFEIRRNGRPIDPLACLPSRQRAMR